MSCKQEVDVNKVKLVNYFKTSRPNTTIFITETMSVFTIDSNLFWPGRSGESGIKYNRKVMGVNFDLDFFLTKLCCD